MDEFSTINCLINRFDRMMDDFVPSTTTDAIVDEQQHKKKKKKNKKKKKSGKKDGVIRKVIDSIQKNEDDVLWVQLDSCGMDDGDVENLCSALKNNTHVLSLDVSGNVITDTGIVSLCNCLREGGATDLIELNVRNQQASFGDQGADALREMMDVRRVIKVEWVSNVAAVVEHGAENEDDDDGEQASGEYSKIVQDLFQVGNGEEDGQYMTEQLNIEEEVCTLWDEV